MVETIHSGEPIVLASFSATYIQLDSLGKVFALGQSLYHTTFAYHVTCTCMQNTKRLPK